MKRREFIAGVGGVCAAWSLTVRGQHTAVPLVRLLAGVLLAVGFSLPTGTSAGGQTAPVTSDDKFVDGLIADLGFQPRELIERVRYLANVPYEAPTQRRLSYCVDGYADKIAKDVKLHERVVSEVAREPARDFNFACARTSNVSTNRRTTPSCFAFWPVKCAGRGARN
jgi:hypothetical protein